MAERPDLAAGVCPLASRLGLVAAVLGVLAVLGLTVFVAFAVLQALFGLLAAPR